MQNMNYYYDFSGQKFEYPLSLSINQFDRQVFSRQSSLEISYVLKGSYEVITEKMSTVIYEHELAIIAPNDIHMLKMNEKESIILTLHIDFSYLPHYMVGDIDHSFQSLICRENQNKSLLFQIKQQLGILLLHFIENKDNIYLLNLVISKLIYMISQNQEFSLENLPLSSKNHENYMKAILFIDQHYQEDIHLEDVAQNLSFSISYASRLFKKYTGVSFVKYLSMVRIRHSLEKLLAGKDSIDEIAFSCGMSAKAYSQAFKDLYGITPSVYRKQFQKNLKYNKENKEQRMHLDQKQIALIQHLINDHHLYQDEYLDIDKENKKFALALKDINNDPWELIKQDVQLDDIVSGEVVRIIEKGAIVKIREGVDAFLPISELSEERVIKVSSVVNIGDTVNAMVIEFKPKNRRMVLSIKEANREPEEDYSEYLETEDSLGSLGELFKDKFKNLQK